MNTPAPSVEPDPIIIGNASDGPFAIDVAHALGQLIDIDDVISLKTFTNSEFCPRFISDEDDLTQIGTHLAGRTVIIVSTSSALYSRQELAMRNLMIARAAKENHAASVMLVEPDLFFSAQDRGPHQSSEEGAVPRSDADRKKFDGQPITSLLYAEMLALAGVDRVVTVHNHSQAVQETFARVFDGRFHNLIPYDIYADYLVASDIVDVGTNGSNLALCAPDAGARHFVEGMYEQLGLTEAVVIQLDKQRSGERQVEISLSPDSGATLADLEGRDVVLFDDMVRTGSTVVQSCDYLKQANIGRLVFAVSHFYASGEGRQKMASSVIDEILTLNTLPTVENRDVQGRLRRKMVVLKITRWMAQKLADMMEIDGPIRDGRYQIDMSSKNPRFTRKITWNDQLSDLRTERMGESHRSG